MMPLADATEWLVWFVEVAVLVVLCAGFAYPAVAYSRNVLYRGGVLLLVGALGCLMVGSVLELFVDVTSAGALVEVAAYVAYAASGLVSVAATWRFAREFVHLGQEGVEIDAGEFSGGFERDS
ncbi:hypothetical protein LPA44_09045 [Halobacterium sp. KA-4]|jgi:hypothetical protein|uniref:hypothetical protein n=1 Tax=Halobacterium sp. KA-4 TaxID=2896367 RepID=UPI001E598B2C|nr:hypothetical protein [Halobacterium sp. KA-4]MCD2200042.1 hypothetical protein [Halobacterium sp. KA-4]